MAMLPSGGFFSILISIFVGDIFLVKCVSRYWEPTLRKGDGLGGVRRSTGEEYQGMPPGCAKSLGNWG